MAKHSIVTKIADGLSNQFSISFTGGFMSRDHITARVNTEIDGAGDPAYRTITWITDGNVTVGGDMPLSGDIVTFRRLTPILEPVNDFQNGTVLLDETIDAGFEQVVKRLQEVDDVQGDIEAAEEFANQSEASAINSAASAVLAASYEDTTEAAAISAAADAATATAQALSASSSAGTATTQAGLASSASATAIASASAASSSELNAGLSETAATAAAYAASVDAAAAAASEANATSAASAVGTTPEVFGAIGDGVADDTAALQAAIDYCAPYTWQGSVSATNASFEFVSALVLIGRYRITSPLRLNKNLVMFGYTKPTFFGDGNNSVIVCDFDDMEGFGLDTAPYIGDGSRPLGSFLSGTQFDAGYMSNVNGLVIHNIAVDVTPGRTLLGTFNMCACSQPAIYDNGFKGANVSIRMSASWAGRVNNNHCYGKAIGFYANKDVTTMDVSNNYISGTNTPDVGYVWPCGTGSDNGFAHPDIVGNYFGILSKFSSLMANKNTIEGFDNGIGSEQTYSANYNANYMEAISDYLYVVGSTSCNVVTGPIFCPSARLCSVDGSSGESVMFDLTASDQISLQPDVTVSSYVDMVFIRSRRGGFITKYNARVTVIDPETEAGMPHKVYVSSSGDDTNTGFGSGSAVLTIQAAIARCRTGIKNEIIVLSGESASLTAASNTYARDITIRSSSTTKATVVFTAASGAARALNLLEGGNLHFRDMNVTLPSASNADYRSCIRSRGGLHLSMFQTAVTGAGETSALCGGSWTEGLRVDIVILDSQLNTMRLVQNGGGGGDVMWTEVNSGSTFTTVTTQTSLKIASKQFP